ncbi:hypothetical protein PHYSODRAFT_511745, partial [Phytophthora sojae]
KNAINAKIEDIEVPARSLQLFLAKNNDAWLQSDTEAVKKLKTEKISALIKELTHKDHELQAKTC